MDEATSDQSDKSDEADLGHFLCGLGTAVGPTVPVGVDAHMFATLTPLMVRRGRRSIEWHASPDDGGQGQGTLAVGMAPTARGARSHGGACENRAGG